MKEHLKQMKEYLKNKKALTALSVSILVIVLYVIYPSNQNNTSIQNEEAVQDGGKQPYGVSAAHPLAVEVGMNVLENGGNAVDAAIAVSYALNVVEPFGSGIGGGGAMLIAPPNDQPVAYDYREVMPSTGELPEGNVGVPGFVKGMEEIHNDFGTMDMADLIQPSIELAEYGFEANQVLTERLENAEDQLSGDLDPFFKNDEAIKPGEKVIQPELAESLTTIQEEGSSAFYEGELGESIVEEIDGLEMDDFKNYSVLEMEPVQGELDDYQIYAAPPPLAGLTLIEILHTAQVSDIEKAREAPADYIDIMSEISAASYQDRLRYIADMNFTNVPIQQLSSKEHAREISTDILFEQLSKTGLKNDDSEASNEDHSDTTHFVVHDSNGMMVSTTNTLSKFFGSGKNVNGMFLNNQLKNFSKDSSSPNTAEAGKRPRSFMAPTILAKDGKPVLGIGTPGGKRIPMVMAQVIIRQLLFGENMQTAINRPRFYVEEGTVHIEDSFSEDVEEELEDRGYQVKVRDSNLFFGGIQSLYVDHENNQLNGGADLRRSGTWDANTN
ncbi:gamma-glutamyltransferase 1 Threonine peptidase. MEROPS family T03 [Alteribacillus persepolensis]|uniref:Glutathione hydrolase proenzyme n=1 Tax=Alteribacillus persepolensis TaxID=568899 RepID=A0A1G8IT02_9BACI|nr:gamma-glutamyltransferase [Alteribacillus persepolensis]SDI22026.1 gamma-glutamyltransferase 1 Threonine peptidase. MEROPS family T03 [Alteribacillus persepolensis]